ncbi:argonaute 2-like protein, partial [Tanacetum coccineum]
MALRGLRMSVTHRPTKETYIVSGLTESIANYVPVECCVLVNDTSFPKELLGMEASRKLEEVSLLSPDVRRSEISRMVHD